ASLTKLAVTMKKISMMKTTSSIGVRSIALSSSGCCATLRGSMSVQLREGHVGRTRQPRRVHRLDQQLVARLGMRLYHHRRVRLLRSQPLNVGTYRAYVHPPRTNENLPVGHDL